MTTKTMAKIAKSSVKAVRFAEGMHFKKLFFVFLIGSVIGAIYEDFLIFLKTWLETGDGIWMLHRGVIYGPFNVVYGFGAVAMCLLLCRKKYPTWKVFLYAALLGGGVEYAISFLQEMFLRTVSWDYSHELLNINGRTTLPFMVVWGLMGVVFVKVVYPWISKIIEGISQHIGEVMFWGLLVFMIFDMSVSWTALIRQTLRHYNMPAWTPVGRFYDQHYTDAYLEKYFPNMRKVEQE